MSCSYTQNPRECKAHLHRGSSSDLSCSAIYRAVRSIVQCVSTLMVCLAQDQVGFGFALYQAVQNRALDELSQYSNLKEDHVAPPPNQLLGMATGFSSWTCCLLSGAPFTMQYAPSNLYSLSVRGSTNAGTEWTILELPKTDKVLRAFFLPAKPH